MDALNTHFEIKVMAKVAAISNKAYGYFFCNTHKFGALRAPFACPSGMKRFWSLLFRYEEF